MSNSVKLTARREDSKETEKQEQTRKDNIIVFPFGKVIGQQKKQLSKLR